MPQRFLKPGLRQSRRWNRVGWLAQSLYIRLVTLVDDFARYEADPELLRSELFPYGDPDGNVIQLTAIDSACEQLSEKDLVHFYEHDGVKYCQLKRWTERTRAEKSKYPAPLTTSAVKCQQTAAIAASPSPSPSPTSPSSPPSTEKREREENFPQCPPMTRMEFNTLCQLRAVPADCAEWFWNTHDAVNWLDGQKRPIQKVEPLLMRTLASWRANGEMKAPGSKPANGTPTTYALSKAKEAKEAQASALKARHCNTVAMGDEWTDRGKQSEWRVLRREIKELNDRIAKSV